MAHVKTLFKNLRGFVLCAATLLSIIYVIQSAEYFAFFFTPDHVWLAAVGFASASLTILTFPVLVFLGYQRKRALPNMILIELLWSWIIWLLWGITSITVLVLYDDYGCLQGGYDSECSQAVSLVVLSLLNMGFIFALAGAISILTLRERIRGNTGVWFDYIEHFNYKNSESSSNTQLTNKETEGFVGAAESTSSTRILVHPPMPSV